jgi:hypothetical protein
MRKIFTIAMALCIFSAFAQRELDFEFVELVEPTELRSTETSGTPLPLSFIIKNNGPDTAFTTDSFTYQFILQEAGTNATILRIPEQQNSVNVVPLRKDLAPGDTLHFSRNLNINARISLSSLLNALIVNGSFFNRSSDITDPVATNNINGNLNIVWYNWQGWGVSVDRPEYVNNLHIYPNPASDIINIQMEIVKLESTTVELYDLSGKLIATHSNISDLGTGEFQLDVADISNGVYVVRVTNGEEVHTGRVIVNH